MLKRLFPRIPFERVNWITSTFLFGTLLIAVTGIPLYVYHYGIDAFQIGLFFFMFCACGFSITLGYHRLFSHLSFQAHWTVRFLTLLFGAGAFENSALMWCCEHRIHHKHVDQDEDPYDVSKGLFHAHIGWLIFKLHSDLTYENVSDLRKDKLVMFQHRHIQLIAVTVAFVLPTIAGYLWGGWTSALGAFLIGGVGRVVFLQHCTFCINSLCHYIGRRPYSTRCSARDSFLLALFTFGEGYHNYHHEFQHDYRNGVKPWEFDPTKWIIWSLSKLGLTSKLRRVPSDKILLAQLAEAQKRIETRLETQDLSTAARAYISDAYSRLQEVADAWIRRKNEQIEITREMLSDLSAEIRIALSALQLRGFTEPAAGQA